MASDVIVCSVQPDPLRWREYDRYFLNVFCQGTDGWHSARRDGWGSSRLLTASNFAKAAGHENVFTTREKYLSEFKSETKPVFTPESLAHMDRGVKFEPFARMLYEQDRNVVVKEVGLAIPKFDIRLGSSVDGLVGDDGMIEIKCPNFVYKKLQTDEPDLRKKIFPSHYDQMQGGMAIYGRSWCDYFVFGVQEEKYANIRVPFDEKYWNEDLYPNLCSFLDMAGIPKQIYKSAGQVADI